MIELHSSPTPNGQKVMIMLEETGVEWKHIDINIGIGEQFNPEHLKLNPNNKIPAIVDTEGPGGGPYTMMESGAILLYLAEKTGKFIPNDARKRYDTMRGYFSRWRISAPCLARLITSMVRPRIISTHGIATTTNRCACTGCWRTS